MEADKARRADKHPKPIADVIDDKVRWFCYRCGRVEVSSFGDYCCFCDNK